MVSNHKYLIDPSPTSWTETEWCCLANALASSSFMEVTRKGFKILTRHCLWCVYPSSVYLTSPHMTSSPSLCICMPQVIENGSWEWPVNEATNMQSQLHSHTTTWGNPPHLVQLCTTKQGSHNSNKLTKSITTNLKLLSDTFHVHISQNRSEGEGPPFTIGFLNTAHFLPTPFTELPTCSKLQLYTHTPWCATLGLGLAVPISIDGGMHKWTFHGYRAQCTVIYKKNAETAE